MNTIDEAGTATALNLKGSGGLHSPIPRTRQQGGEVNSIYISGKESLLSPRAGHHYSYLLGFKEL